MTWTHLDAAMHLYNMRRVELGLPAQTAKQRFGSLAPPSSYWLAPKPSKPSKPPPEPVIKTVNYGWQSDEHCETRLRYIATRKVRLVRQAQAHCYDNALHEIEDDFYPLEVEGEVYGVIEPAFYRQHDRWNWTFSPRAPYR